MNQLNIRHLAKSLLLLCLLTGSSTVLAHDFAAANSDGKTIYYKKLGGTKVEVTFQGSTYSENKDEYSGRVVIPSTVTYSGIVYSISAIGDNAFAECASLTSVIIPTYVTSIGNSAFSDCSGLTSVTIPNTVTSIGNYAFSYCRALTSLIIPSSVTSIGEYAFNYCRGLTSIEIPESITSIPARAFNYCSGLTSMSIPESVTSIGTYAFSYCSAMQSLTIPASVASIEKYAFNYCNGLTSIKVYNENPANISMQINVFYNVSSSRCTLYVPVGTKTLYSSASQWGNFDNIVEFSTSGINSVINDAENGVTAPMYDISGRRVLNPAPGLYIQNGRKILIK